MVQWVIESPLIIVVLPLLTMMLWVASVAFVFALHDLAEWLFPNDYTK